MNRPLTAMLGDRYGASSYAESTGELTCAPSAVALVNRGCCLYCKAPHAEPLADYCSPECFTAGEGREP